MTGPGSMRRRWWPGLAPPVSRFPTASSTQATLLDLICAAGLSTREEADRGSGRGMGMGAVRAVVQEVGGTLTLESDPGTGRGSSCSCR
jgi:chemotaxis protein histidine kinase CheA